MRFFTKLFLFASLFFSVTPGQAQILPPGFSYTDVASGWNEPVGTAFNSTGTKLFVWEKAGKVFVCNWNSGTGKYVKQTTAVLDISAEVGNWRDHGMLGFAIDPNFDVNGYIYCLYVVDRHHLLYFGTGTYNAATNDYNKATIGRITRYTTTTSSGNLAAIPATRNVLLGESRLTGIPILYESHGVGSLVFASDGTLLASTGDAASYINTDIGSQPETYYVLALDPATAIMRANENVGALRSQMLNSHAGKILRIDPANGNGIASNPFYDAASPRSAKSRVWAFGFRNPFRMCVRPNTGSTNPATGDIGEIYVTEVGLDSYEELNIIKAPGTNCGWPIFEGLTPLGVYASTNVSNKDEPNPLYGIGGCTQQWFTFTNLVKQATADNNKTIYNPCNPAVPITSIEDNRFIHRYPAIDWKHYVDSARVGVFNGNTLTVQKVGTAASGVTGLSYQGNASVGGCWYTGTMFPPAYQNTYFAADYGANWIKNFKIEFTDKVQRVDTFETGFAAVVHISMNPLDGSLFCTDIGTSTIKKIVYGGNQAPIVKMSSDKIYGPKPLLVNFTGNASFDPEGGTISYSWDFGDGTALSTSANPSHSFTVGNNLPKKYVVKLTVKDNLNASNVDSLIISLNNTPPTIGITSPVNNSFYQLGEDSTYALTANVTDAEHPANQLGYVWRTYLRHNNHEHPQPLDTAKVSGEVISRIGCNGDNYYWLVKLIVTDNAGLSATDSVKIFPQCGGPLPVSLTAFGVVAHGSSNVVSWTTSDEINLRNFEIERSCDGANFEVIGAANARMTPGVNNYSFTDNNFLDGYIYYRLKINDIDNKFSRSFTVRVFSGTKTSSELTISPNPFKNEFLFGAVFKQAGKATFRLIDAKGAVIKTIRKQVSVGFNSFQVDKLDNISKGIYFLEVIQDKEIRKTKLIKDK